jgi:hypothetical protein
MALVGETVLAGYEHHWERLNERDPKSSVEAPHPDRPTPVPFGPMDRGNFQEHLEVTYSRTIQGALSAGATIRSGATLVVQGAAAGHFEVEAEATLMVQGILSGTFDNQGTVIVQGIMTDRLPDSGHVAVAAGTILTSYGPAILRPDGGLEALPSAQTLDIRMEGTLEGHLAYNTADGTFEPLTRPS